MFFKPIQNGKGNVWDFYRDGVTQSFIGLFRHCPVQCKLKYFDGWTSKNYNEAFHFGECLHYVLQHAYLETTCPLSGAMNCLIKSYQEIWEKEQNTSFTTEQERIFEGIYARVEVLIRVYKERYKKDWENNWLWTENNFKIEYPIGLRKTFLQGKIDGGFETPDGKVWLIDHKTMSIIDIDMIVGKLPFDTQCMLYLLAYKLMTGKYPAGIVYNIIRKPQHKQGDKTIEEFQEYLETKIREEPDHFFIRRRLQILPQEIDEWEKNWLIPNLKVIERWFNAGCSGPEFTLNPDSLETKYGKCEMFDLLTGGNSYGFYKREHVFPELV